MPPGEAANIISQVGDAIQYAHERGMIHRDIKPANIMLDVYGKAILMDFGIAKILGGQLHTATGAVVGTAMYMSPEQIVGERVDERSDIYSLGVTLFETLSGKPPFEADSAMTLMMMHMNDPLPNIRELRPELPDDLVQVAEKALEKKKEQRFQSAAQMSASLKAHLYSFQRRGIYPGGRPTARWSKMCPPQMRQLSIVQPIGTSAPVIEQHRARSGGTSAKTTAWQSPGGCACHAATQHSPNPGQMCAQHLRQHMPNLRKMCGRRRHQHIHSQSKSSLRGL